MFPALKNAATGHKGPVLKIGLLRSACQPRLQEILFLNNRSSLSEPNRTQLSEMPMWHQKHRRQTHKAIQN